MSKPLRILIAGYYGYANAGDEVVLSGILRGIDERAGGHPWEARALSGAPADTSAVHGIACYPRFSVPALIRAVLWCDCLVLGGGSLIQDATSRRSALYYMWLVQMALALRRKVFLWAQGFGPLQDEGLRSKAAALLSRVSGITLRDAPSQTDLQALGIPAERMWLTADPAFLVHPADRLPGAGLPSGLKDSPAVFGVSLRTWPSLERSLPALVRVCREFSERSGASACFVPFQLPHDVEISRSAAEQSGAPQAVMGARLSPAESVRLFGEFRIVMGMRLHSLILSAMSAVPFVGLSYDPKVERFCAAAGMPCLTISQLESGQLLAEMEQLYGSRETAAQRLEVFAASQRRLALQSAELFWESVTR